MIGWYDDDSPDTMKQTTVNAFEISNFITYKEYKVYLSNIKSDSGNTFYKTQFPDSSICLKTKDYEEYLTNSKYDDYPVLGISWNNAINYCNWKHKQDHPRDTTTLYRLPLTSEWLAAYHFLTKNEMENDLNKNYMDWLFSAYSESAYQYPRLEIFPWDYTYNTTSTDQPVYHRKMFIGNCFLFDQEKPLSIPWYGYSYDGYRYVGFRMVKIQN